MEPRFEFTFSYWVFAWFLLYWFRIVKYNPKIWLIIALLIVIFGEIFRIIFKKWHRTWIDIFLFIVITIIIKVIPIWILRNTRVEVDDFLAGIVLFIGFALWMVFRLGSINEIIKYEKDVENRLTEKKAATPLINFLHKWYNI